MIDISQIEDSTMKRQNEYEISFLDTTPRHCARVTAVKVDSLTLKLCLWY